MIGDTGHDIPITRHLGKINRCPQQRNSTGMRERVAQSDVEHLAVQSGGQARRIVIPVEHIKRGRVLTNEVVIDPVIPNQVIGAQPGEHPCHLLAFEDALHA